MDCHKFISYAQDTSVGVDYVLNMGERKWGKQSYLIFFSQTQKAGVSHQSNLKAYMGGRGGAFNSLFERKTGGGEAIWWMWGRQLKPPHFIDMKSYIPPHPPFSLQRSSSNERLLGGYRSIITCHICFSATLTSHLYPLYQHLYMDFDSLWSIFFSFYCINFQKFLSKFICYYHSGTGSEYPKWLVSMPIYIMYLCSHSLPSITLQFKSISCMVNILN